MLATGSSHIILLETYNISQHADTMYGYKILRLRLRHTCMQRHSLSAFGHVVLWVSAIILRDRHAVKRNHVIWLRRKHVRLTNINLNDVTTSEHPQYIRSCISCSFTGDKIKRNLLRQTIPGVKHSDVSEADSVPIFRVIPLEMGTESVSETS